MPDAARWSERLPEALHPRMQRLWSSYLERAGATVPPLPPALADELARVWAVSDFVAQACIRAPDLLADLLAGGDLARAYPPGHLRERLAQALAGTADENDLGRRLRLFRRREMVRIAWRDIAGRADLVETTADLSDLAEAATDLALDYLHRWHCELWGTPYHADGRPQRLVVIGMGKLGARELNFSSDIDLIFAYAEDGETRDGRRSVGNQEFFVRLSQRLINALGQLNAYGLVFRVDMRLRPFGESSALAIGFDAMEEYYQVHGREWERYALVKARVIAGDREGGERLLAALRPFVYRRYVDFGAFESLREMKRLIEQEVRRKGVEDNVKLGPGGIREVEFIGQAFQLVRGGREPALRERRILVILETLQRLDLLPEYAARELAESYRFLRTAEHRAQQLADQQTHLMPAEPEARARVALGMGFPDWPAFERVLRRQMARVHQHFERVFAAPQAEQTTDSAANLAGVWLGGLDQEQARAQLCEAGYAGGDEVLRRLHALRDSHRCRALSAQGRARLERLMPLLLAAVGKAPHPDAALEAVLGLVEAVTRRSAYLALLVENPMALSQLVRLCAASTWITRLLTRHPQLLDELLDPRSLYNPPRRAVLVDDLRQRLLRLPEDDQEQYMDALRHFVQVNMLRVAAADVVGAVPLMVVSDHLTELAEVVLAEVLDLAWRHLAARHGVPRSADGQAPCDKGFAIIAYGKLGGIELGYGSDLDVVFLHHGGPAGGTTDGARPIDENVFFARLGQRVIHILTARTSAGALYEVDLRLRPSGASGLLVSNVDAFATYQREQAWTWEHQALVRARPVAGDPAIADAFQRIRREVLGRARDRTALRHEVRQMREKMRTTLSKGGADRFDLKQDRGGIADIEFMVQYGVLAWAHEHPALLDHPDNVRLLDGFAQKGLLPAADCAALGDAYRAFRARAHRLTLDDLPALVSDDSLDGHRRRVTAIWEALMERDGD